MARVDRDCHAEIIKLAEHSALPISEPRSLGPIQCGELSEQKWKFAVTPLSSPLFDKQRKQFSVFSNSCGSLGVIASKRTRCPN